MNDRHLRWTTILGARGRLALAVLVVGGGVGLGLMPTAALWGDQSVDEARVRPNRGSSDGPAIHALARLEPASGLITVGARPGVRLEEVRVREGDLVKSGAVLALLEGHAQAEGQLAVASAQKTGAVHQRTLRRDMLALQRDNEDRLKQARLESAQRLAKITKEKFQGASDLSRTFGAVVDRDPKVKYELAQAAYQLEVASIKADLELKELETGFDLLPRKRALEDREAAVAGPGPAAEVLASQVEEARRAFEATEVRAPNAGRVLELIARPGEVSSGPLLALGDDSAMVAKAEVYQSDVARLELGDPATVDLLGKAVAGKVTWIGRIVGGNELRSIDPRALQDLRVVKVTIALDDPTIAAHYMNMQVDVTIRPRQVAAR